MLILALIYYSELFKTGQLGSSWLNYIAEAANYITMWADLHEWLVLSG